MGQNGKKWEETEKFGRNGMKWEDTGRNRKKEAEKASHGN